MILSACGLLYTLAQLPSPGIVESGAEVHGRIVDSASGKPIPARVYIQSDDGKWYFPQSAHPRGSAIPYRKQSFADPDAVEMHTTLSAHPFVVRVPQGRYTITVERGKEYLPNTRRIVVGDGPFRLTIHVQLWINMAARGWYSGDTHVHRTVDELPNVMPAEDLNVAFPLSHWVSDAFASPATDWQTLVKDIPPPDRRALPNHLVKIDETHVFWPVNTEFEVTNIGGKPFNLGGFFVINHRKAFETGVPPVRSIAAQVQREGGLIDLDKHSWFWAMMLVPVMPVDLYELTNNHIWRTKFAMRNFGEAPPAWMKIPYDEKGGTERGWIDYGFQAYYALLDCGFNLRPTAGTASGVHPVPLGFGRVYVHLPKGFSYGAWVKGLNAGRSFVTTGPMLLAQVNGQDPGRLVRQTGSGRKGHLVTGTTVSSRPILRVDIVVNGQVTRVVSPANRKKGPAYESSFRERIPLAGSGWIAVRCYEAWPDGRMRFAHTAPFHIKVAGRPLRPRREEVDFLVHLMEDRIARTEGIWPEPVRDEYRRALLDYQRIRKTAR